MGFREWKISFVVDCVCAVYEFVVIYGEMELVCTR